VVQRAVGRNGAPVVARPTERDIEILKLRFRYLPSDYIHAFVGGNEKALTRRLNLLSRKPNLYLVRPHQQRQNADTNYRRLVKSHPTVRPPFRVQEYCKRFAFVTGRRRRDRPGKTDMPNG